MSFAARLKRGANIINLNASPYSLSADFTPPTMVETPIIATGNGRGLVDARRMDETQDIQTITVSIHVQGNTVNHVRALVDDLDKFLRKAGDIKQPTTFEWKPSSDISFEPTFGQNGAYRTLTVLWGEAEYNRDYGWWDRSKIVPDCKLTLLISSSMTGTRNKIGTSKGGIFLDTLGRADGSAAGVMIPSARTGIMNNPVFGHDVPTTDWTVQAGLITAKNTDKNFILFGRQSLKVTRIATSDIIYQSKTIPATTHVASLYCKKQDSSAVTESDVRLVWSNSAQTGATINHLGNGFYVMWKSFTGSAGAAATGISLDNSALGVDLYICGMDVELGSIPTVLASGEFPGCSWNTAAHSDPANRTVAYWRIATANVLNIGAGTISVIWTPHAANTAYAADGTIFTDGTLRAWFTYADDKINFTDGVNTVNSSAITFAAGTPVKLDFTYKTGALVIYLNGVAIGTGATYTPRAFSTNLYLGSSTTPDTHLNGTFNGLTIYQQAATAAEILAKYTNDAAALAAGKRVEWLPGIWTPASSAANKVYNDYLPDLVKSWVLIFDLPGSISPDIWLYGGVAFTSFGLEILLSCMSFDYGEFEDLDFLIERGSPTAVTLDTTDTDILVTTLTTHQVELMAGKTFYTLVRGARDGADNISLRTFYNPGAYYYYSDYEPASFVATNTSGNVSHDLAPGIQTYIDYPVYDLITTTKAAGIGVQGKRATGSDDFDVSQVQWFPEPLLKIVVTDSGDAGNIIYDNGRIKKVTATGDALAETLYVKGNQGLILTPGQFTAIFGALGAANDVLVPGIDAFNLAFYLAPRWALL